MKQTVIMMNQQVGKSLKSPVLNSGSDNRLLKKVDSNYSFLKIFLFVFVFLICAGNTSAQLNLTITSSSINNNLCSNNLLPDGNPIILYAGGTLQYYQWQVSTNGGSTWANIGGATASTYTVPSPNSYRFVTSFVNPVVTPPVPPGSQASGQIDVNSATALSITNSLSPIDELFPTNSPSSIYINTTYPPDYLFIDWYRNGVPIPTSLLTSTLLLKLPGNYMAVAGGCTPERSNVDIVKYETSNVNWDNTTYASGATFSGTASISSTPGTGYLIGGNIIVQGAGNVTIAGVLNFTGCYYIKVENGGTLTLTDNTVLSATDQWKGILVESGGVLNVTNNSYICDAVAGVIKQGTGNVTIQESTFGRNALHLAFDQYSGTYEELVFFDTFGHVLDPDSSFFCGYSAYNNLGINRGTYTYVKGTPGNHPIKFLDNQIYSIDTTVADTTGWLVVKDQERIVVTSNDLQGFFDYGLRMTDCSNVMCDLNDFYNAEFVAADYGYPPSWYPKNGSAMYFKDNHTDTIMDNEIKGWINGTEFYLNNASYTSLITGNRYRYGDYGLLIANIQNPVTSSTTNFTGSSSYATAINLRIKCNLFKFNNYGIIGSGNLNTQGTNILSAGNRFYDVGAGGLLNVKNSIIWNNNGSNIIYYCNSVTGGDDDPQRVNNGNLTIDGTALNGSTMDMYPNNNFTNVLSEMSTSQLTLVGPSLSTQSIEEDENGVSVYPNPNNGILNIKGLLTNNNISIIGYDGRVVFNGKSESDSMVINISDLPSGIYIIRLTGNNGEKNIKLIKTSTN